MRPLIFFTQLIMCGVVFSQSNVMMIVVDDLRPELSSYGQNHIYSPNIDRLAAEGTTFTRAYCQQSVCSPSRTSFLTGLRPDSTEVYDLSTHFRSNLEEAITLPQYFKNNGYETRGYGKVYHGTLDDSLSWTQPLWKPSRNLWANEDNRKLAGENGKGRPFEKGNFEDELEYRDGLLTRKVKWELDQLKNENFFMVVGFHKPHLPFSAPSKYWEYYDTLDIQVSSIIVPPKNSPSFAMTQFEELRSYHGIPDSGPVTNEDAIQLIKGYYACVSFIDAQIGEIMTHLEKKGLDENTTIVLVSDHGYKLSEYSKWNKHTNFQIDTRVPLIFKGPGIPAGLETSELVELIDLYPTLVEMVLPEKFIESEFSGKSLKAIFDGKSIERNYAVSQYIRPGKMGYSFTFPEFNLVLWFDLQPPYYEIFTELYDLQNDPNETINIAFNRNEIVDSLKLIINSSKVSNELKYYSGDNTNLRFDIQIERYSCSNYAVFSKDKNQSVMSMEIFTSTGKKYNSFQSDGPEPLSFNIDRGGLYFFRVSSKQGQVITKKIFVSECY